MPFSTCSFVIGRMQVRVRIELILPKSIQPAASLSANGMRSVRRTSAPELKAFLAAICLCLGRNPATGLVYRMPVRGDWTPRSEIGRLFESLTDIYCPKSTDAHLTGHSFQFNLPSLRTLETLK